MYKRACILLFVVLSNASAQKYIDRNNGKILNISTVKNVSSANGDFNVLRLWERFSKIIELTNATSKQCRWESQLYLEALKRLELWALKMFDATAKPPSGILSGNGIQYGDFDECLSIDEPIKAKYCLASLQVSIHGNDNMKAIDYLVHSGHMIRSNLTDPGHRLPRYSSLLWAICIPSSCSSRDLEEKLSQRLSDLGISIRVDSSMCAIKNDKIPYSFGELFSIVYFSVIGLFLSLGTVLDDGKEGQSKFKKLLNAFSLKRNLRSLLNVTDSPTKVKGLDAFRGISGLLIVIIHKGSIMFFQPFLNKLVYADFSKLIWTFPTRLFVLFVDSFLYISGFSNANSLLLELERKGTINVTERFVARWFRLFPLFISVILMNTYIVANLGNGPQWNLLLREEQRNCKKNIWRSIFFIHNYLSLEEMCIPHTHQIGFDVQLYVITVPLMIIIWNYKTLGWFLLVTIAIVSTVLRYLATYWYNISMIMYSEISLQSIYNMAKYSYILPTHKSTIYLQGVVMAYVIRYKIISIRLTNVQSRLLWLFCFGLAASILLSPYRMAQDGYQYEHFPAALFAAFSPILWGLFLGLSQWAICNDYAGIGTTFLESRVFKFYQKISYSVYLVHLLVFIYNTASKRNAEYFTISYLLNVPEIIVVLMLSIIATVTIEMPFTNIHKIYFGQSSKKLKDK